MQRQEIIANLQLFQGVRVFAGLIGDIGNIGQREPYKSYKSYKSYRCAISYLLTKKKMGFAHLFFLLLAISHQLFLIFNSAFCILHFAFCIISYLLTISFYSSPPISRAIVFGISVWSRHSKNFSAPSPSTKSGVYIPVWQRLVQSIEACLFNI